MKQTDKTFKCLGCGHVHKRSERRTVVNGSDHRVFKGVVHSKESQCARKRCKSVEYITVAK